MPTVARRTTFVKRPSRMPVVAVAGVSVLLAGCLVMAFSAPSAARVQPKLVSRTEVVTVDVPPTTIAAVGDSVSAWNGTGPIANTWTMDLSTGPVVVDYAQGWATGGKKLADMAAALQPVTDDYMIVMGGVNDVGPQTLGQSSQWGTPMPAMIASLEQIVADSGLPADQVIISAIAPDPSEQAADVAWNVEQQSLATQFGWHFIDPFASLRGSDGLLPVAVTLDGLHPNDAESLLLADNIVEEVQVIDGPQFTAEPTPMQAPAGWTPTVAALTVIQAATLTVAPVVVNGSREVLAFDYAHGLIS